MLATGHRLRRRDEFAATVRAGRRAGRGSIVVHMIVVHVRVDTRSDGRAVRAGFVVPRAVGNAVVRNKVRRRLRHLVRERMTGLAPGTDLVVRASAGAAARSYQQLGTELDAAIASARAGPRNRKVGKTS